MAWVVWHKFLELSECTGVYCTDPVGSSHSYCDCQCHCQHSPAHDILYPSKPDSNIISGSDDIETKLSAPLSLSIIK